jgi:hypothetical protein
MAFFICPGMIIAQQVQVPYEQLFFMTLRK